MKHPDEIAKRFHMVRGLKNYREIGQQAGVAAGQWHSWEKGKNVPTLRSVRAIAAKLGVDPEWILEGKGRGPQTENFVVKESPAEYKADRLNRDLLKPLLPMTMLMWLVRELPRIDSKLTERLLRTVCDRCAFEDQMVWEVGG